MNRTAHWLLFCAILLPGIFLRFHALDRQSLWDDEVTSLRDITLSGPAWLHHYKTREPHPPLYGAQLRVWQKVMGHSVTALRANSAVWGTLSLVLLYRLAALYCGPGIALLAMALATFSPYHLAYSQEMRPYAFAITMALIGWLVLERTLRRQRTMDWVWLWLVWTVQLYAHYWASFGVASQGVYGLWKLKGTRPRVALVLVGIGALAIFALWLPILLIQIRVAAPLGFWMPPASFVHLPKAFLAYTGLYFNFASLLYAPWPKPFLVFLVLIYAAALVCGLRKAPVPVLVWLIFGNLIPFIIHFKLPSMYLWYRYPFLLYPAFPIVVAAGLMVWPRTLRIVTIGLLLGSSLWGCRYYATQWQKANPKPVIQYADSLQTPASVIIRPAYFSELFVIYHQGASAVIDENVLDSPEKRAALRGKDVIFIKFDATSDPVGDALVQDLHIRSSRYFPGFARLGVTVYQLQ